MARWNLPTEAGRGTAILLDKFKFLLRVNWRAGFEKRNGRLEWWKNGIEVLCICFDAATQP
jgi:hypothetical protein